MTFEDIQQRVPGRHAVFERSSTGLFRRTLTGIALLVYSLLFTEVFLRIFDPQAVMPRYITGTAWGVRGNIPNAHYWHHTPEVDVQYSINAEGLRSDRNYPFEKTPGTCRIAVFGDSFFFGLEADYKDTFGAMLEARLRERGISVEVLNFAVGGFGTAEMLRTYEAFGLKFDPDVVIFSWDISDLNDNVRSNLYRLRDGQLERAAATYLPAVKFQDMLMRSALYRFIDDHSHLYTFLRERASLLLKKRALSQRKDSSASERTQEADGDAAAADAAEDERRHRQKIDLSLAILERARDEVVASGREFYLIDIPVRLSRTRFTSSLGGMMPNAERSRLNVVSPLSPLLAAARPDLKLYYEKGLGHFTPAGMGILANEAFKALSASPRLSGCTSTSAREDGTGAGTEHATHQ